MANHHNAFRWDDPFLLDQQLTADERAIRDAAAAYCQDQLAPRVQDMFRHEKTDVSIFREMGALGLLGPTIPEAHGGAGYINEYPVERFYRDARLLRLYEGTTQVQQLIVGRELLRQD
ncbi:MAG: hypothetical protein BGO75_10520 [Burkholderiales bacterium 68-20]|nr:MAG: hypothetical protein BGO75_10520 [Burkholderiales bacterium 68-20]